MKHSILKLTTLLIATSALPMLAQAEEKKAAAGPNGGKIVEFDSGKAEFFVQPDRKVSITFLDEKLKPVAPAEQVVTVVAQPPSGKTTLEFEKTSKGLVSKTSLPEGEGYTLVLQVKATADAKPQNQRIKLDMEVCGECKHPEYACVCEGHGH